jgi:hypothetical protein
MASVIEAGEYLQQALPAGQPFFAIPATEFGYYADRPAIYDYRLYFLSETQLGQIFRDMAVGYVVIPDSAIVPDEEWTHVGRTPSSFVEKVANLYDLAYVTAAGDVRVYQVTP